jgi:HAD superfamily hydrolase (TIGR01549 family)
VTLQAVLLDNWNTIVEAPELMRPRASLNLFLRVFQENELEYDREQLIAVYREISRRQVREAEEAGWTEIDYPARIRETLTRIGVEDPRRMELTRLAWRSYLIEWPRQTKFYPSTPKVLEQLRQGYRLGLVSNFMDGPTCREVFDRLGYEAFFESLIVSAEHGYQKPSRVLFDLALRELRADPAESVMVGDTYHADVVGAHRAGLRGILIDPSGEQKEVHGDCDAVIKGIAELPQTLLRF